MTAAVSSSMPHPSTVGEMRYTHGVHRTSHGVNRFSCHRMSGSVTAPPAPCAVYIMRGMEKNIATTPAMAAAMALLRKWRNSASCATSFSLCASSEVFSPRGISASYPVSRMTSTSACGDTAVGSNVTVALLSIRLTDASRTPSTLLSALHARLAGGARHPAHGNREVGGRTRHGRPGTGATGGRGAGGLRRSWRAA